MSENETAKSAELFFSTLMEKYLSLTPGAQRSLEIIKKFGENFFNDHVAFRSFQHQRHGIKNLERVFLDFGYKKMDNMHFDAKMLNAYWYLPPSLNLPKVFISELEISRLSDGAQKILNSYLDQADELNNLGDLNQRIGVFQSRPWQVPSLSDYQTLQEESEYAAWTLVFGNKVNHFTISVNHFEKIRNIFELNQFLLDHDVVLNNSNGIVKGEALSTFLLQSSTVADLIPINFSDSKESIPYAFMEFAERFLLPENSNRHYLNPSFGNYFQGFVPNNADKIFESTYRSQIER